MRELEQEPFVWGQNDCVLFSGRAVESITGFNPVADWVGKYDTAIGAQKQIFKMHPSGTLEMATEILLGRHDIRPKHVGLTQRGDVVLWRDEVSDVIGICMGGHAVTASHQGPRRVPMDYVIRAWGV